MVIYETHHLIEIIKMSESFEFINNLPRAYIILYNSLHGSLHKHRCAFTFGFRTHVQSNLFIASQFLFGIKTINVTMY